MRVSDVNRLGSDLETDGSDLHSWINIPLGTDGSNYNKINVDTEGRQSSKQYIWDTDSLSWVAANSSGGSVGGASVPTDIRMDDQGSYMYVGEAAVGTASSVSAWKIRKVSSSSVTYADASATFSKVWDSRASYTY